MQEENTHKIEAELHRGEKILHVIDEELSSLVQFFSSQKKAAHAIAEDDSESSGGVWSMHTMQLLLQYRLDLQDALTGLLRFSQSLWQILGISPAQSSARNLERLSFALGSEDLHHALSILSQLIDALLRILNRYYSHKTSHGLQKAEQYYTPPKMSYAHKKLTRIVEQQKTFNQLMNDLEQYDIDRCIAVVPGFVKRLNGPILNYFKALQHGLYVTNGLYQQLETASRYNQNLSQLIQKASLVLNQTAHALEPQRLYKPTLKKNPTRSELDERASEKRLGQFFYHP